MADWSVHQLCIRDVLDSNLGVKAGYPEIFCNLLQTLRTHVGVPNWVRLWPPIPIPSNSLFFNFSSSGRCIVKATKTAVKDKVKNAFPVHTVKAYRGSKALAPLILKLRTSWSRVIKFTTPVRFTPGKYPLPIEQEAGLASESFWTFWTREKSVATDGIRTQDRRARSLVAIPTEVSRSLSCYKKNSYLVGIEGYFRWTQADGTWSSI